MLQTESILFISHQIRTRQINHRSCSAQLSVPFRFSFQQNQNVKFLGGKFSPVLALLISANVYQCDLFDPHQAQSGAPRGIWKFSESQN